MEYTPEYLKKGSSLDVLDRREWERLSCELDPSKVSIRLGAGRRLIGLLVDESPKGIGLQFPEPPPVRIGQEVEAYYQGSSRLALVRWVEKDSYQRAWRMGLEFVDTWS
jgi:hypothetical protein